MGFSDEHPASIAIAPSITHDRANFVKVSPTNANPSLASEKIAIDSIAPFNASLGVEYYLIHRITSLYSTNTKLSSSHSKVGWFFWKASLTEDRRISVEAVPNYIAESGEKAMY